MHSTRQIANSSNVRLWRALAVFPLLVILNGIQTTEASQGNISALRFDRVKSDFQALESALEAYHQQFGTYPTTEEGLTALVRTEFAEKGRRAPDFRNPEDIPLDPWGRPYNYAYPGFRNSSGFDLWTYGKDGVAGGSGENRDCGNWTDRVYRCGRYPFQLLSFANFIGKWVFLGALVGLPIFLAGFISKLRKGHGLRSASIGFHLGATIYLIAVSIAVPAVLFWTG